ncbi:Gfo/Idh/MocA family protein [Rathayibacter soli]|uniref:Gfo/Idh/MocA family protein n=1 Tax=Rathayibacter soli TaxID=3144168 RepID=UPI0027E5752E|nr:Gfo/Idh/MocA family oxidoreductase [Glaciibacter superstes]
MTTDPGPAGSSVARRVRPVRLGVLGYAAIFTGAIFPSLAGSIAVTVTAIASRRQISVPDDSIRLYTGEGAYQQLLDDPQIDAVYIPLPNHLHKEWTIKAAEAGKHVLCEKPLGVTAAEASEMVEACSASGVQLVEAFMYRYNPQHSRAREILRSGEIGELALVRVGFTVPLDDPHRNVRYGPYPGAGAIHDVGSYGINLARWMMGDEPTRAHAFACNLPGTQADILHAITLEFPADRLATISGGLAQARKNTYELIGSTGRIEVERPFATPPFVESDGDLVLQVTTPAGTREEAFPDASQYAMQMEQFARLVRGEPNEVYRPDDSILTLHVIDACMRSLASGASERVNFNG